MINMSKLIDTDMALTPLANGRDWRFVESFDWTTKDGYLIRIPRGFVTNFVTVKRIFWMILSRIGRYTKAAAIHDYLYSKDARILSLNSIIWVPVSQEQGDDFFLEAMLELKVKPWRHKLMYRLVRKFGNRFYKGQA